MLVMLAGTTVRTTGSGMGCPDWPKCFGYYIPPTDVETLTWRPHRDFKKGNMILKDGAFYTAQSDFTSGEAYNPEQWVAYTKHDYNVFNPVHTWIEYINRLIGALSGLPVLAFFIASLFYFRRAPIVTILGGAAVLLLGFAAWLGKLVVDGNLIPHSITYHMFSALALIGIFAFLTAYLQQHKFAFPTVRDKRITALGFTCILLLLVQVALGTEVREEVDAIAKSEMPRSLWIDAISFLFEIHRTFSLLILGATGLFAGWLIRTRVISTWPRVLLFLVVLEVLAGMGLAYLGMPAVLQPVHLMFAVFMLAMLVYLLLSYHRKTALK